jgi:BASS family bile acid:Na+ symporter
MRPVRVLESYSIMMLSGLALGLVSGGFPSHTKEISMASLAVLMTLSLSNVGLGDARGKEHIKHSARALLINYGLLTGLILALGVLFSRDYWWGWVLMAAAPSAVSIVPFTTVMGGQTTRALFSTAVNYVAALLLMPAITLLLIGSAVSTESVVSSLLLLIILPMAASRLVMRLRLGRSANTIMINLSFALLIFAVTGANRDAFLDSPMIVLAVSAVGILRTFGTGMGTELVLKRRGVAKSDRITYVLFASYKNLGLTATLAIALFEPIVAVPATICIVFEVLWVIFLVRYYQGVAE